MLLPIDLHNSRGERDMSLRVQSVKNETNNLRVVTSEREEGLGENQFVTELAVRFDLFRSLDIVYDNFRPL
jgi:hypothetical protein